MKVAVTGAMSYSGRYLTRLLLDAGNQVVNLSNRTSPIALAPLRKSEASSMTTYALKFDEDSLSKALEGCDVVYCTYWIRFADGENTHEKAVERVSTLFDTARKVGVKRIVYSSHTRTSTTNKHVYLSNKAFAEEALKNSGIPSYGIVRPCGIFGDTPQESILFNNAAYVMKRTPLFLLPNDGQARFQPIHVRDMAELMFQVGQNSSENLDKDACGPDCPTALELFTGLKKSIGAYGIVLAPGFLSTRHITLATQPLNWLTKDILLDTDDLDLMYDGHTTANNPDDPDIQGRRSVFEWMDEVGDTLGKEYISSFTRYYRSN